MAARAVGRRALRRLEPTYQDPPTLHDRRDAEGALSSTDVQDPPKVHDQRGQVLVGVTVPRRLAGSVAGVVPGAADADRDVEGHPQLVGGAHLPAYQGLDGLPLPRRHLEDQLVVHLQQHPAGQPLGRQGPVDAEHRDLDQVRSRALDRGVEGHPFGDLAALPVVSDLFLVARDLTVRMSSAWLEFGDALDVVGAEDFRDRVGHFLGHVGIGVLIIDSEEVGADDAFYSFTADDRVFVRFERCQFFRGSGSSLSGLRRRR